MPNGAVRFMYDEANHLIGEYQADGSPTREYVWLGDLPVAVIDTNTDGTTTAYAIETDHLGTPRLLTDATQSPSWRWTSPPFGEVLPDENPAGLYPVTFNLRFPGQYYDKESGLSYNWHRVYDAETGRYVQSDPIGLQGGWNTYAYVGGNPLSWSDPRGLAIDDFPPPPPGYNPKTWRQILWDNGRLAVQDPESGRTYTCHPEDKGHWRHWDIQDKDGDDDGSWPPRNKKPWPGQKKAPYGDQSGSDPSGDAQQWQPPAEFSGYPGVPGLPYVPLPSGPLPSVPPVRAPIFVPALP